MKKNISKIFEAILLNESHRSAGSATFKDGVERSWDKAYQLTVLSFGDTRGNVRKYCVAPECESTIEKQLSDVSWGAYISLELDDNGRQVVAVNIICDPYSNLDIL